MVFFAVIGNLAVISVILTKRVLRTKINIYLLNLSIADLLMATLNAMFNFISMVSLGSVLFSLSVFEIALDSTVWMM